MSDAPFRSVSRASRRARRAVWFLLAAAAAGTAGTLVVRNHQRAERDIPVLMYHNIVPSASNDVWAVSVAEFDAQMAYLKGRGYSTVLPEDIYRASRGRGWLPRKPFVVTFDDGLLNVQDIAEPVLRKYGFRGIAYCPMAWIAENAETRGAYRGDPLLTWEDLRGMRSRGTVDVGVHSLRHDKDMAGQIATVGEARGLFKRHIGRSARSYCYPNGSRVPALLDAVRFKNRYHTALICDDRIFHYSPDADLYQIPRVSVYGGAHGFVVEPSGAPVTNGTYEARLTFTEMRFPARVVLRDRVTGAEWNYQFPDKRHVPAESVVRWEGVPDGTDPERLDIEIWEQNGLWPYDFPREDGAGPPHAVSRGKTGAPSPRSASNVP